MDIIRKATNSLKPEDAVEKILDLLQGPEITGICGECQADSVLLGISGYVLRSFKGRGFQPEALFLVGPAGAGASSWLLLHGVTGC